MMFDLTHCHLS